MKKRFASLFLALALCLSLAVPALAVGTEPIGFYANGVVEVEVSGLTPGQQYDLISIVDTSENPAENLALGSGTVDENGVLYATITTGRIEESNLGNCYVYVYNNGDGTMAASGPLTLSQEEPEPEPYTEYTITFNTNGGTLSVASSATTINRRLTALPNATRANHTLDGWYTAASGGDEVTTDTVFTGNTTIYAHWTAVGGGGGTSGGGVSSGYAITVEDSTHGTIRVSPTRASRGDTVTITVTPGYELDRLLVTDSSGEAVTLTNTGDGTFAFEMPGSRVTVETSFVEISEQPEPPVCPLPTCPPAPGTTTRWPTSTKTASWRAPGAPCSSPS